MPELTTMPPEPRQVVPALRRADALLAEISRLKAHVPPRDPLAALVVSAEASARASRTSLLVLYLAGKKASEADEADEASTRQLRLAGGTP